jgi:two-component system, NtrC family, nitrogen regulation sensor histidine kinase NtrY
LLEKIKRNRFLKDHSYLLFIALLLFCISIFTQRTDTKNFFKRSFSTSLQSYILKAETNFENWNKDTAIINACLDKTLKNEAVETIAKAEQFLYLYKDNNGIPDIAFWSTQTVVPDSNILKMQQNKAFVVLKNGFYLAQKKYIENTLLVSLLPIKWNYIVANDYLKNEFAIKPEIGENFEIQYSPSANNIKTKEGLFLFSLKENNLNKDAGENRLTIWLRIFSFLPLLLFIHFTALHINQKRGLLKGSLFLIGVLFIIRLFTYFFSSSLNFRQFELFDPAVYGTDIILKSLGDLLINALIFLWVVNFIRNNVKEKHTNFEIKKTWLKWLILTVFACIIIFTTYAGSAIIRSMVADSQISFDVMNFFSLNVYSFVGFLVLCSIAIGYYYFCSIVFYFVHKMFNDSILPFFAIIAVVGLCYLSLRIGSLSGGFELYNLIWILLFLVLVKNDLSGYFSPSIIVSKMVFWLFFFSASIASIIITENNIKEIRNRKHYAEVIAEKNNTISDVLLNTILTEFRTEVLTENFYKFKNEAGGLLLRDSLINNNFNSYTDNYETKVLVYDSVETPLYNQDPISYTSINSILNTQAKPTALADMFSFENGFEKSNYLCKRIIRNNTGAIIGYVFIVISPQSVAEEKLYPALFSRGSNNSLENSSLYAYAIYDNNKLVLSHNDYAFSTKYSEKAFIGKQYLQVNNEKYNELWYNTGANKYVVIVKENKLWMELITLFSYLFCTFILLNALSSFISLLLQAKFKWRIIKNTIKLSIRQQVHGTIISFSILSFLIIGVATILFFVNSFQNNNQEMLNRTSKIIGNDLTKAITKILVTETAFNDSASTETPLAAVVNRLAEVHGHDINLYNLAGDLKASSISLPYQKGIVSTKLQPLAYAHLNKGNEIQYYQKEKIGSLDFVSNYIPVLDNEGQEMAYLNIPYFTSENKLKEEISTFLVTIIILNAFILLIAGIIAIFITNRITNSFSFISNKMKEINLSKENETIEWTRKDEIGELVNEYNKMVSKLDESAATLARTERENAWQEMAKQVAHEIKNPLTPMKLSMQFLQKAINENAPNIKELSAKVSATLVEQMDHLSNIASEFSRFANIENANPEKFNLNDAIISIKQLYEEDTSLDFVCKFSPNEVFILADKTHVNRILTNLILNGIQSVKEDTKPSIVLEEILQDSFVTIKISDNGAGIKPEMQDKIFMPNFTTKTSGTGLGLSMCKRMAEQAGGSISFSTSEEVGTSFFVSFPIAK